MNQTKYAEAMQRYSEALKIAPESLQYKHVTARDDYTVARDILGLDPVVIDPTGGCRFAPSCSHYARGALEEHGLFAGTWLTVVPARKLLSAGMAECHVALGEWGTAADAAAAGWSSTVGTRPWAAVRFALWSAWAEVERALDDRARRMEIDLSAVAARARDRLALARAGVESSDRPLAAIFEVQLRHAATMVSLLEPAVDAGATAEAWADVATRWEQLPERWMAGEACVREAEACFAAGDAARTAAALRAAHVAALEMSSAPLLARVEAVSRRTRISVESAELVVVDERSADRLGLTPREAEVLGLVAAGRTNRQIGESLYVSEKTASVHVSNILRKLGVSTRVEAAAVAQRLGIG